MRVFSTQRAVGLRSRWGEDLGALKTFFFPTFLRGGFEPRPGRPTALHFEPTMTDAPWTRQPARMAQIRRGMHDFTWQYPRRAEIFAPPLPGPQRIFRACTPYPLFLLAPGFWLLAPSSGGPDARAPTLARFPSSR